MTRLIHILSRCHDTSGGHALRQLIWSLWTQNLATLVWRGCPRVNLFDTITSLDDETRAEFAALLALPLQQRNKTIDDLLHASGEWDRIDRLPAFTPEPTE
jgi:hypothetical protein